MADFQPFRAWRYNLSKINFSEVIAPPYDIISEEAQQKLYDRSPHNCVRLILNKRESSDDETRNGYSRAREFFQAWRDDQTLVQDRQPCFYLYRQIFKDPLSGVSKTRHALLGRLKLEPFDKGIVVPHEKTLSKPKEDRRKLLEATQTSFSPVFGLYEDSKGEILRQIEAMLQKEPDYRGEDSDKVLHEVWIIREQRTIDAIHGGFSKKKIYIADGHHRYQTALDHSLRVREKEGAGAGVELPSDFVLMALVEMNDPGLMLMATHRMVLPFKGFQASAAVSRLEGFFKAEAKSCEQILDHFKSSRQARSVVSMGLLLADGRSYLLTLKDIRQAMQKMAVSKPESWCRLDVTLLNHLILAKLWDLPESEWEATLRYTHSASEAIQKL